MGKAIIGRGFRFSLVGALCTLASYLAFVGVSHVSNYLYGNVAAWAAGFGLSFALNRGFTYRIRGVQGVKQHLALFLIGSLLQMSIAALGFWLLIDKLHLNHSLAFVANLPFTAGFMFAYMELVAFGRGRRPGAEQS